MDENMEIPDESMRHIEALLARHRPDMIQRMFQQAMDSRRWCTPKVCAPQLTQRRTQLGGIFAHISHIIHHVVGIGCIVFSVFRRAVISYLDHIVVPLTAVHGI
jgi:hypothetical protein